MELVHERMVKGLNPLNDTDQANAAVVKNDASELDRRVLADSHIRAASQVCDTISIQLSIAQP